MNHVQSGACLLTILPLIFSPAYVGASMHQETPVVAARDSELERELNWGLDDILAQLEAAPTTPPYLDLPKELLRNVLLRAPRDALALRIDDVASILMAHESSSQLQLEWADQHQAMVALESVASIEARDSLHSAIATIHAGPWPDDIATWAHQQNWRSAARAVEAPVGIHDMEISSGSNGSFEWLQVFRPYTRIGDDGVLRVSLPGQEGRTTGTHSLDTKRRSLRFGGPVSWVRFALDRRRYRYRFTVEYEASWISIRVRRDTGWQISRNPIINNREAYQRIVHGASLGEMARKQLEHELQKHRTSLCKATVRAPAAVTSAFNAHEPDDPAAQEIYRSAATQIGLEIARLGAAEACVNSGLLTKLTDRALTLYAPEASSPLGAATYSKRIEHQLELDLRVLDVIQASTLGGDGLGDVGDPQAAVDFFGRRLGTVADGEVAVAFGQALGLLARLVAQGTDAPAPEVRPVGITASAIDDFHRYVSFWEAANAHLVHRTSAYRELTTRLVAAQSGLEAYVGRLADSIKERCTAQSWASSVERATLEQALTGVGLQPGLGGEEAARHARAQIEFADLLFGRDICNDPTALGSAEERVLNMLRDARIDETQAAVAHLRVQTQAKLDEDLEALNQWLGQHR